MKESELSRSSLLAAVFSFKNFMGTSKYALTKKWQILVNTAEAS